MGKTEYEFSEKQKYNNTTTTTTIIIIVITIIIIIKIITTTNKNSLFSVFKDHGGWGFIKYCLNTITKRVVTL